MSEVVSKLRDIQIAKGLTDMDMAERLNCSRQLYQKTRSGIVPLGNKILKGISTAFPELKEDVIYFLSSNDNGLASYVKQSSEPQGKGIKRFIVGLLEKIWKL